MTTRLLRWLPPLLMPPLVWLAMAWFFALPEEQGVDVVSRVLRVDGGRTQPVVLPFEFRAMDLGTRTVAFEYRIPPGTEALLVPYYDQVLSAWLDGRPLRGYAQHAAHPHQLKRGATLYALPVDAAAAGHQLRLEVSSTREPGWIELGPFYLGPQAPLEARFRRMLALSGSGMQAIALTTALIAAFASLLWLMRPGDTVYGWFAAGLASWLVYELNFIWTARPIPQSLWMAIIHVALACSLFAMTCFLHRFLDAPLPRRERRLASVVASACAVLLVAALVLEEHPFYLLLHYGFRLLLLGMGGYLCAVLLRAAWRTRRRDVAWLLSAAVLASGLAVHDSLRMLAVFDAARPSLFQYGVLATVLVFGWILLERFVGALREAEMLNRTLDAKVRSKSLELEAQFAERRRLERENLLAAERQRIMTDMHDGIGGQLASVLAAVRRGGADPATIEQALAGALDDLRLMIDSMDPAVADLAVALGMFRSRVEPQLAAAGIASHWDTARLEAGMAMSPSRVLDVFRILQEAVANAVRHGGAQRIGIAAHCGEDGDASCVAIRVEDDGCGLAEGAVPGRGLANMRMRASRLRGRLELAGSGSGTVVALVLPLRCEAGDPQELG